LTNRIGFGQQTCGVDQAWDLTVKMRILENQCGSDQTWHSQPIVVRNWPTQKDVSQKIEGIGGCAQRGRHQDGFKI